MPEYIERENAYKLISEQKEKETGMYSKGKNNGLNIAKSIIHDKERCPTANVVEVVRCKDCKHWIYWADQKRCSCIKHHIYTNSYDFCNYGVLKESKK